MAIKKAGFPSDPLFSRLFSGVSDYFTRTAFLFKDMNCNATIAEPFNNNPSVTIIPAITAISTTPRLVIYLTYSTTFFAV